jgi:hypothetical protein
LSSLATIFSISQEKSPDSEKLLHLYWNRAELKKEFAGMRKEQFRLQDKIKLQEGVAARLEQKLDHLEELLVDPDWAHDVFVFYQLRGLAFRCQGKLAKFAEHLKQQREQKQHNLLLVSWNETRTREARMLERQVAEKHGTLQQLEDQLEAERHRLVSMSGFRKIFKRRSINAILFNIGQQIAAAQLEEHDFRQRVEEVQERKPPGNPGLNIASKRSINLMIIAFTQQLLLNFEDDELATMAKEASEKSVGSVNYGTHNEREEILARIQKQFASMEQASDVPEILQRRAKLLGEKALFRSDTDAIPLSETVATMYDFHNNGVVKGSDGDVLGGNWWGISNNLCR